MSLLAATQTARRISAHSSNVVPGQAVEAATYKISRDRPGGGRGCRACRRSRRRTSTQPSSTSAEGPSEKQGLPMGSGEPTGGRRHETNRSAPSILQEAPVGRRRRDPTQIAGEDTICLPFNRAREDRGESSSPDEAEKCSQSGVQFAIPSAGPDPAAGWGVAASQAVGDLELDGGATDRPAATAATANGGRSSKGDSPPSTSISISLSDMRARATGWGKVGAITDPRDGIHGRRGRRVRGGHRRCGAVAAGTGVVAGGRALSARERVSTRRIESYMAWIRSYGFDSPTLFPRPEEDVRGTTALLRRRRRGCRRR